MSTRPEITTEKLVVNHLAAINGTLIVNRTGGCGIGMRVDAPAVFEQGITTNEISELVQGQGIDIPADLYVDNINEYTLNHGVLIEGVLLKDGTISVPLPGVGASIQNDNLTASVTVTNDETVYMVVNNVEKWLLTENGGVAQGDTSTISATGNNSSVSGQGTTNIVGLLGKPDIDGRTGAVNSVASGTASHAEGGATVASGDYSHAEGAGTQATGKASHAEGLGTKATGIAAHAEGDPCLAAGDYSHAEGKNCAAMGTSSHAAGENSTANADNSWCWSDGTVFSSSTPGSFSIRAGGNVLIDNGSTTPLTTLDYNNQTTWSYTPANPGGWPVVPNNMAQALDTLVLGTTTFSAGTTGFTPNTPTSGNVVLGGTLNVQSGGTGVTTLPSGGILYGRGINPVGTSVGTVGQLFVSGGSGTPSWSGPITYNGTTITGIPNPVNSSDTASKGYVDSVVTSFNIHQAVRTATTADLGSVVYFNGSAGVGATLTNAGTQVALVLDGITVNVNDRVLVKNQTNQTQNGIYVVTNTGSGSSNWVLTRASDYNNSTPGQVTPGDYVFDSLGNTQAATGWVQINYGTGGVIVIGVDAIIFTQFSGQGTYLAGTGLNLVGNVFNNTGVLSVSGGSSGLTFSPSTGAVVLTSGALAATYGGTGLASYTTGDLLVANTGSSLTRLSDVATGNALLSGGVGASPVYGKVNLTTTVSGVLPVANGGTGNTTGQPSGTAGGDLFGTYPNPGVKSFQSGISLNGTVISNNIGVGVGSITSITTGTANIGIGTSALTALSSGSSNVAVGYQAMSVATNVSQNVAIGNLSLLNNAASQNTAVGASTLVLNTSGSNNSAFGYNAANNNGTGLFNSAFGASAMANNSTGSDNSAFGYRALLSNTSSQMTAFGSNALAANTSGLRNVAVGYQALLTNVSGSDSTAVGYQAAQANTASQITAIGSGALAANTSGTNNTGLGYLALTVNLTGTDNTAVGNQALANNTASFNVAVGSNALVANTGGNSNISVGYQTMSTNTNGSNSVCVGHQAFLVSNSNSNVGVGYQAGVAVTSGASNTFVGTSTAATVTTGSGNVVIGASANLPATTSSNHTNIGAGNTTVDDAHSLGFGINAASVIPGTVGLTVNNNPYQIQMYTSNFLSTVTAAGTTTLSVTSARKQYFTGTMTQTVVLPVVTTLANGFEFEIYNLSSSAVTINTSGGNTLAVLPGATPPNATGGFVTCIDITGGTGTASWSFGASDSGPAGGDLTGTYPDPLVISTNGTPFYTSLALSNTGFGVGTLGTGTATGNNNTALGYNAASTLTSGNNVMCLGAGAQPSSGTATNEITLGNSSVTVVRSYGAYTYLSDERDKKNITPIKSSMEFIKRINPMTFDWNMRDGGRVDVPDVGFIAQNLLWAQIASGTHVPGLVHQGNPDKLEVSPDKIIPHLVRCVQECMEMIERLEGENRRFSAERSDKELKQ